MAKQSAATINTVRLERERRKTMQQQELWALSKMVVASPMFQILGTVAITEILENQKVLTSRWAGAVEGGVITMVGLQALKDYGVIGAAVVGGGIGLGSLTEGKPEKILEMAANAVMPGGGLIVQGADALGLI